MTLPEYVLITPARNEALFLKLTIESIVAQTVRPLRWVIVSDGSTDGTDKIVNQYAAQHPWIELMRMPERRERHFSGKANAVNAAYNAIRNLEFQVIGNLDADISLEAGHFAFLLSKLAENPTLGVVGTPFREVSGETYDYRFVSIEHVSGACQVFRRECFEQVGGYVAVKGGSIDHIAVVTARMKGWKTRTFTDKVSLHHREMGTAQHGVLTARFKIGAKDYAFGNHLVWELFRTGYQMTNRPFFTGGAALLCGYLWAAIRRIERPVSPDLVAFHRCEQMRRLRVFLTRKRELSAERLQHPA